MSRFDMYAWVPSAWGQGCAQSGRARIMDLHGAAQRSAAGIESETNGEGGMGGE